jgi:uncharacterized protein (TIGR03437 family)
MLRRQAAPEARLLRLCPNKPMTRLTEASFLRACIALAALLCCTFSAVGQNAMAVGQTRYELRQGEAIPIVAPQTTLDFLARAASRHVEIVNGGTPTAGGGGLVAGPNRAGDQILLGASQRMNPGEYTVNLTATNAAGETQQTTLSVSVKPRQAVPTNSTRPPVVLLNGWESGFTGTCPVATSSSETFGNLAQYLVDDGVPDVYLFDNCLEDPTGLTEIENLATDLGTFLNSIQYTNGAQVPQIDLVAFSMGGLVARAYLAGQQTNQTFAPPTTTLVRDLVLIATPNFGSFVAGNSVNTIPTGTQSAELVPGSAFLYNLATWNQRNDDLRGVNTIAVIGNAGNYSLGLSSSVVLADASDGLVSLTSASLGFTRTQADVTRIVPYCHVDPGDFTNTLLGAFACDAGGIANVNSTTHYTGLIVRSFLAGTSDWQSIGNAPAADPYLSKNGAMFFAMSSSTDNFVSDMSAVAFGTVPLVNGGDSGTIFYVDFVFGTGILTADSASLGAVNCGSLAEPLGYTSAVRCKLGPVIFSVGPLTGTGGTTVSAGSTITITGSGFGAQCSGCKVVASQGGATTGQVLTISSWTNTSIKATLPATLTDLVVIQVVATAGDDAISIEVIPQATLAVTPGSLQFAYTTGGAAPASQSIQIANSGTGTLSWTATASTTWINLSAASGTAPSTLSVSIAPAGLSAGTYTGSVTIASAGASNTPASIGVTLTVVQAPPVLAVSPLTLAFQYTNGGTIPAPQNIAITNAGGGTLAWTASTDSYWLVISAASGTAPATLTVSVNPVNLAAGTYTGNVQISSATSSPPPVSVTLVVTGTQPAPAITGLSNDASFQPAFASGTWVAIFGTNLSQSTYQWQASDFVNGQLPTSLEGVSVTINGVAAYVEYISPTQINVLAPDDATTDTVQAQVTVAQQNSNMLSAQKAQFAPAFFTFGDGYVAALHTDYSLVGAPNLLPGAVTQPAQPGSTILLYATGFGPTNPPLPTAQLVATPEPLANTVQITIGGATANVSFGGLVGPGLYQFNVTVPNLPNGDAAVVAKIGGVSSQTGVSVTIQQ